MDCEVCQTRSSVGYCVDCKKLLCEACGITCALCGRMACADHVHVTRSGKRLCGPCTEERRAQREKSKEQREAGVAGERAAPEGAEAAEEEEEERALVVSGYQPPPPWKLSLYAAGAGVFAIIVVLAVPTFRTLAQPWTSWAVVVTSVIALFWAAIGLFSKRHADDEERPRNYIGAGLAVLGLVLAIAAFWAPKAPSIEDELKASQEQRANMTPAELKAWRDQRLQRYR